jgi:uncharacterized protein YbbC (DUF1343 family)
VVLPYTLGELARLYVAEADLAVDLAVVPVSGWSRQHGWDRAADPWIPPSPNIPSLANAYAYLATGVLQATNVSEGRGTTMPFRQFGAPFLDAARLTAALAKRNLPGVEWRETYFKPEFNKYAGEICAGTHLMVAAPREFRPVETSVAILQTLGKLCPERFLPTPTLANWFDGTPRSTAEWAETDAETLLQQWDGQVREFRTRMTAHELYGAAS